MHRKGVAVALTAVMVIAMALPGLAGSNPFPDLPRDHWAYDYVTGLAAAGLVEGFPDGTFGGDRTFTRYEMAMVFTRILDRLDAQVKANIDEKVDDRYAELTKQVNEAAAEAQKAVAQAIAAESKAEEAAGKADTAKVAADAATEDAAKALARAEQLSEVAEAARALAADAEALAEEALARTEGTAKSEEVAAARELAEEALRVARQAKVAAQDAEGGTVVVTETKVDEAAVAGALEAADRAAALAKKAAEQAATAQKSADEANEIAKRASALASSAAKLEDVVSVAAQASEARALASAADERARVADKKAEEALARAKDVDDLVRAAVADEALSIAEDLDDAVKMAIAEQVANQLVKDLDDIKANAAQLARRVDTIEGRYVSEEEAEAIANRVVAEKLANALDRISSLENAVAAMTGDPAAVQRLLDEKTGSVAADLQKMSAEFRPELDSLGVRVSAVESALEQATRRADNLEAEQRVLRADVAGLESGLEAQQVEIRKLGAQVESSSSLLQDKIAKDAERFDDIEESLSVQDSAIIAMGGELSGLQVNLKDTKAEVDALEADIASLKSDLALADGRVAELASDVEKSVGANDAKIAAVDNELKGTKAEVDALEADVATLKSDLARANAKVTGLASDVEKIAAVDNELKGTKAEVDALEANVASLKSDLALAEAKVAQLASDVEESLSAHDAAIVALDSELQATKAEVDSLKSDQESNKTSTDAKVSQLASDVEESLSAHDAAIVALNRDLEETKADLAPIKRKFEVTDTSFGTEVGFTGVYGSSLYDDPRAPYISDSERAAKDLHYDTRTFANRELFLKYMLDVSTIPVPGTTLSGQVFVKRDLYYPGEFEPGIDIDLTTEGALRSLHVGELNDQEAALGFNKYVLDADKWRAQLWRINGAQALVETEKGISANVLAGHGRVRNIDMNTGNDASGQGDGSIAGASVEVPFGEVLSTRLSWMHLGNYLSSGTIEDVVTAGGLEVFAENENYKFGGAVATRDLSGSLLFPPLPQVGDVSLARKQGPIKWAAEYGYSDDSWSQRLASSKVDGLAEPWERYTGVELNAQLFSFDTALAHRYSVNEDGPHPVWMVRAERDFTILVPFTTTVEYGINDSELWASDEPLQHAMVDLAVKDLALIPEVVTVDAGYRFERTPLQAETWDQRWRNGNIALDNGSGESKSALDNQFLNWIAKTDRATSHAKATWHLSPNIAIYAGGKWVDNETEDSFAESLSPAPRTLTAGMAADLSVLGGPVKLSYEVEDTGSTPYKHVLGVSTDRAIGAGSLAASTKLSRGQGSDTKDVTGILADMNLELPVYEATSFQMDGRYARSIADDPEDYTFSEVRAGVTIHF